MVFRGMSTWVLLRGLTRESRHWGDFPGVLGEVLGVPRVLTFDLPGNGALNRSRSPTRIADMVEFLRAALRSAGAPPPVYLLGLSLGGMVAIDWAVRYATEVAGCVLIGTSLRAADPFYRRLRPGSYPAVLRLILGPRDPSRQERAILELTSRRGAAQAEVLRAWTDYARERPVSRGNALRQLWAAARYHAPASRPPCPVLLLAGGADRLVDPRCSQHLAQRWQADCALHPAAGHDLPLDDGRWVADQVRAWLGRGR
jgi:pimeloyl-ACP methyl ester carboxylesterase